MNRGLSPKEVRQIFYKLTQKPIKIVDYDKIISGDLNSVFGNDNKIIIFYPALKYMDNTIGHYVALIRTNKQYYFYDPLGYKPDEYKKFALNRNELYRERTNSLIKHFLNSGMKVDYNNHQHQSRREDIATCGRHSAFRCIFDMVSNDDYHDTIKMLKSRDYKGRLYDEFIYDLTK